MLPELGDKWYEFKIDRDKLARDLEALMLGANRWVETVDMDDPPEQDCKPDIVVGES